MRVSNLYSQGDCEGAGQDLRTAVTRIAAGDSDALASLYDRTQRLVHSLARRIVGQPEDAEEVTLDVYAQVWRDAARYHPDRGSVEGWLVTITRSRAIDQRRVRAARPDMGGGTDHYLRDLSRMDDATCAWEPRQRAMKMLKALAPGERQLITLAFFEGYTHRELSNLLALPLGTVKTRIRLSLLRMRQAQAEDESKRLARVHDAGRGSPNVHDAPRATTQREGVRTCVPDPCRTSRACAAKCVRFSQLFGRASTASPRVAGL